METNKRNLGIDFLRIISMFMVVILHVLGNGGVLWSTVPYTMNYNLVWLLEILAYCSVNCYALITGYVSTDTKFKYSRIISLWLQVAFYTVTITLLFGIFVPSSVGKSEVISAVLPMMTEQYWYFTAYFGLFFFIPFLNELMNKLSKEQLKKLIITIIIVLSLIPTFSIGNLFNTPIDLFNTGEGYSMLWLMALYIVGGYFKKHGFPQLKKHNPFGLYYLLCVIVAWVGKLVSERFAVKYLGQAYFANAFIGYTSPFIFFSALFLFLYFAQCKIKGEVIKKAILLLGPASFGVYLIHVQPLVWDHIISNRFAPYSNFPGAKLVIYVLITAALIYISCSMIDLLRIQLFKLLRINKFSTSMENQISKVFKKIFK